MNIKQLAIGALISLGLSGCTPKSHSDNKNPHPLYHKQYLGIPGVEHINSGKPGPTVVISACTHGGETAGLQVIDYLTNEYNLHRNLITGEIYFVLVNRDAYQIYLKNSDFRSARYVHSNMNRCATPEHILHSNDSEGHRLREIYTLLANCDIHIDIHSTTLSAPSMAILTSSSMTRYYDAISVDEIYIDLTKIQTGKPLIDICERSGGVGIGFETGLQTDSTAYTNGVRNILQILNKEGMITTLKFESKPQSLNSKQYTIIGSILVHNKDTFKPTKEYSHGEFIKKGTVLAQQGNIDIIAKEDCIIILPTSRLYNGEEYCFLAKKNS